VINLNYIHNEISSRLHSTKDSYYTILPSCTVLFTAVVTTVLYQYEAWALNQREEQRTSAWEQSRVGRHEKQKDWKKLQKDSFVIRILYPLLLVTTTWFTSERVRFMRHTAWMEEMRISHKICVGKALRYEATKQIYM